MDKCIFCKDSIEEFPTKGDQYEFSCPNCGLWGIKREYVREFTRKTENEYFGKMYLIAGYLYEFNISNNEPFIFTSGGLERVLKDERIPKTPMRRLERLLVSLYKIDDTIGLIYEINFGSYIIPLNTKIMYPISLVYARNFNETVDMFSNLEKLGYMRKKDAYHYSISPAGFERAEQLLSSNVDSISVFVAMGFREDLIEACEKAIKPACKACGFDAHLISDKPHNNGITDEIMVEIKRSKFVIVDFTYNNSGAYFEAGYAQGLGRPIIRCCKDEWFNKKDKDGKRVNSLHFDVQHYNTIIWKNHEDLYRQLKNNIRVNIEGAILDESPQTYINQNEDNPHA
ncbi:MAG: nucleoside 2-deoxyribosyltransferase [Oscillospiraceae bacterium]|nr:nucleoside 2-deoxyribosyltransferase [Oscillospiraceae bacterium]